MKTLETNILRGPNIWSRTCHALVVMHVDTSVEGMAFTDAVRRLAPPIEESQLLPLEREAMTGYLMASIAIQLQQQVGIDCTFKTAAMTNRSGITRMVFEYGNEPIGWMVADIIEHMAETILQQGNYDISDDLARLQEQWDRTKYAPLTESILQEAVRRKIPYIPLNNRSLIQLGFGALQKRIQRSATERTSLLAARVAGSKDQSNHLLRSLGVPVPEGRLIFRMDELEAAINAIGYPVVLKPEGGNKGKGVTVQVTTQIDAVVAFNEAKKEFASGGVMVEQFISGSDYRLLVVDYKLVAAAKRIPPMITGDGVSTIAQLIDILNSDPQRGTGSKKPLNKVQIDGAVLGFLRRNGHTLSTVLPAGRSTYLKSVANLSAGGTTEDATTLVHPDNILWAERIAKIVGLDVCGIDIISPDISVPIHLNKGVVIEVNSTPGFRVHLGPTGEEGQAVAGPLMDMLFPEGSACCIPIIAIAGQENGGICADLMAQLMTGGGYKVGCASSSGIRIQHIPLTQKDATDYHDALMVLKDPTIDLAVLECGTIGIIKSGLAFPVCNVGIVVDVPQQGSRAAAVITGCIAASGYAILNADNPAVYRLHEGLHCQMALISMSGDHPDVVRHIGSGGYAAIVDEEYIYVCHGPDRIKVFSLAGVSAELAPSILAAVLTASIYGVSVDNLKDFMRILNR